MVIKISTIFEVNSSSFSKRRLRNSVVQGLQDRLHLLDLQDLQDVQGPQDLQGLLQDLQDLDVADRTTCGGEPIVLVQAAPTSKCYANAYKQRVVTACFQRKRRRDPEVFERHGRHDFGRPMSSFVARKLCHKGIYKMCLKNMRCDETVECGEPRDCERLGRPV